MPWPFYVFVAILVIYKVVEFRKRRDLHSHLRERGGRDRAMRYRPTATPAPRLTADDEERLSLLAANEFKSAFVPRPADRSTAERSMVGIFVASGLQPPAVTAWARSPREMFHMRAILSRLLTEYAWDSGGGWRPAWIRALLAVLPAKPTLAWWAAAGALQAQIQGQENWPAKWRPYRKATSFHADLPSLVFTRVPGLDKRARELEPAVQRLTWLLAKTFDPLRTALFGQLRTENVSHDPIYLNNRELNRTTALGMAHDDGVRVGHEPPHAWLAALAQLDRACHGFVPLNGAAILCENPVEMHVDEERRLHSDRGAALRYADGFTVAAIHGVRVPVDAIRNPRRLSVSLVQAETEEATRRLLVRLYGSGRYRKAIARNARRLAAEPNGTLMRELLAAYGEARFIQRVGEVIHEDTDPSGHPRRLWQANRRADGPLTIIEVRNSTPDARGRHARVWLRVPPHLGTCQAAVAWTFGMNAGDYQVAAES